MQTVFWKSILLVMCQANFPFVIFIGMSKVSGWTFVVGHHGFRSPAAS